MAIDKPLGTRSYTEPKPPSNPQLRCSNEIEEHTKLKNLQQKLQNNFFLVDREDQDTVSLTVDNAEARRCYASYFK